MRGKDDTYQLKALMDLVHSLKSVFEKYSQNTRTKVWDKITSKRGEEQVKKLIKNPSRNLNLFRTL